MSDQCNDTYSWGLYCVSRKVVRYRKVKSTGVASLWSNHFVVFSLHFEFCQVFLTILILLAFGRYFPLLSSKVSDTDWKFGSSKLVGLLQDDSCVSCETRISHQSHFSLEANYWRMTPDAPRLVLDVSYLTRIMQSRRMTPGAPHILPHCTGRFIWDKDQSSETLFVAGAVFGEVGGWLRVLRAMYTGRFMWDKFVAGAKLGEVGGWLRVLRALYWTFHVRQGSIVRVIFVAGAIFGEVGGWLRVVRTLYWSFHVRQG